MKVLSSSLTFLGISWALLASTAEAAGAEKQAFAKRVIDGDFSTTPTNLLTRHLVEEFDKHPNFRRRHVSLTTHPSERQTQDFTKEENCDKALLQCLPENECADCFRFLYSQSVDWGRITPETGCEEVTSFLATKGYCSDMHDDQASKDAFCKSFNACAVWEEETPADQKPPVPDWDCDSLTECNWDGMVKSFIGDGICQDSLGGCYNTAICNWDGGDCCPDTCSSKTYVDCGHDGFACRNPNSTDCDPKYSLACENMPNIPDENNPDPALTICKADETKYRLTMYDTFGDGWDQTKLTIYPKDKKGDIKFNGQLEKGSVGTRYVCLPTEPTCIHVDVNGGEWGNEASWELKPMTHGAPALGAGGAPMDCDLPVGGNACNKTCLGHANVKPNNDPEYKEFKEMFECIEQKCTIQVGICEKDDTCKMCLAEEKADFCYGSDTFLAVVDCTMCQCTNRKETDFCHQKLNPGMIPPIVPPPMIPGQPGGPAGSTAAQGGDGMSPRDCSPGETMKGSNAVLTFGQCTDFDQVSMLVTNYDQNKFGLLDQFEACAHSFAANEVDHGGHTALGCMQILVNAMNSGDSDDENAKAIASLASLLYHNSTSFCECAAKASADCPLCSSFVHMKSLLYESLDACQGLDEVDCDALTEFHKPCETNIIDKFGEVDFSNTEQCTFVHGTCGGAGPFPAFRHLDCGDFGESAASQAAWEFYEKYSNGCLPKRTPMPTSPAADGGGDTTPVSPAPTPEPTTPRPTNPPPAPTPPTPRPTPKPYISGPTKPYVPPEDDDNTGSSSSSSSSSYSSKPYSSSSSDSGGGGGFKWVRNILIVSVLGVVGFIYYKRRTDAFSFVRYRNTRNYAGGESEMYSAPYSGLTMDSGSGAFQPPSLPPTPSAIDGAMGGIGNMGGMGGSGMMMT